MCMTFFITFMPKELNTEVLTLYLQMIIHFNFFLNKLESDMSLDSGFELSSRLTN